MRNSSYLSERLRQAITHAGELPEVIQQDIAEQIEGLLAVPRFSPERIDMSALVARYQCLIRLSLKAYWSGPFHLIYYYQE